MVSDVTVITVNFKTPDLIETCITSFRDYYSDLPYIVVDNGGCPESLEVIDALDYGQLLVVKNSLNVGHGPALNQALALVNSRYAFLLDSDTETQRGGFLEKMLAMLGANPSLFAVGWLRWVNAAGVAYPTQDGSAGNPYIHPYACLLDVSIYRGLHPFTHTGAPAIHLMTGARAHGWSLANFPIQDYVTHKGAGTRGCFGGQWNVDTDREPNEWTRFRV